MSSDARKEILVSMEYVSWLEAYFERLVEIADKMGDKGFANEHTRSRNIYAKILRMLSQITVEQRLQPAVPIRLARKEAKVVWMHTNKIIDNLSEKVLPEYNSRIAKDPKLEGKLRPYIVKTTQLKAKLVLGLAEVRRLL
jgi:hypothetical protein